MPVLLSGDLLIERSAMRVYRKAFMDALANRAAADSPFLAPVYTAQVDLLLAMDDYVMTLPRSNSVRRTWVDVTIFERNHPDIEELRATLELSATYIDAIFREAIANQGGPIT